jgi:hypothetical protein
MASVYEKHLTKSFQFSKAVVFHRHSSEVTVGQNPCQRAQFIDDDPRGIVLAMSFAISSAITGAKVNNVGQVSQIGLPGSL